MHAFLLEIFRMIYSSRGVAAPIEWPEAQRITGSIIHSWGPFRVRTPARFVREGSPDHVMTWHVISIMLSPEYEATIGPLNNEDVSLPGLVRELRRNLPTLEHTIETWDLHLHELEQPGGVAVLQAALDEEAARRRQDADDTDEYDEKSEDTDGGTGKQKRTLSPNQVLANQ